MPTIPLHRLLEGESPGRDPVAIGASHVHTRAELLARAAAVAERVARAGGGRWLLDVGDAFGVAVCLLGVAAGGGVSLIPPNRQPGTLARLTRLAMGTWADSAPASARAGSAVLAPLSLAPHPAPAPRALDADLPCLELYTSGTTGEAKEIPKTLRQLDEVAVLEESVAAGLPRDAQVFATASPHHLYGLLFRVLWPLASGRPFHAETWLLPEELIPRMAASPRAVLVSTPAHLRRLAGRRELARLRGRCLRVFSSGGPLDAATADAVAAALGAAPLEIFGSTETGGVGHREAGSPAGPFAPLPGVRVAVEPESGRLVVSSPFVSVGAAEDGGRQRTLVMGDRAQLVDGGGFLLQGRADRVLKIGEKRLSLPEMESRLRAHPAVMDCRLLGLPQGGELRVAAVIATSDGGRQALSAAGRRELARRLAEHLAPDFDRVLLPRAWRFVDELPRDARGKASTDALGRLFEGEAEAPREPRWLAERRGPGWLARELEVPEGLAFLEGHFPGMPLVAGVVQLSWAVEAASRLQGGACRLVRVEALKFPAPLLPGTRAELRVEAGLRHVSFRLASGERLFATGRLVLEAEP